MRQPQPPFLFFTLYNNTSSFLKSWIDNESKHTHKWEGRCGETLKNKERKLNYTDTLWLFYLVSTFVALCIRVQEALL